VAVASVAVDAADDEDDDDDDASVAGAASAVSAAGAVSADSAAGAAAASATGASASAGVAGVSAASATGAAATASTVASVWAGSGETDSAVEITEGWTAATPGRGAGFDAIIRSPIEDEEEDDDDVLVVSMKTAGLADCIGAEDSITGIMPATGTDAPDPLYVVTDRFGNISVRSANAVTTRARPKAGSARFFHHADGF